MSKSTSVSTRVTVWTLAALLALLLVAGSSAQAGIKYFDDWGGPLPWDNSTANWGTVPGGPYTSPWATYDEAVFEGTGGTVNLSGPTANRVTFNTTGYVLTGSTLGFGDPGGTNFTANADATINSTINQPYATGINKAGTGTLTLNGSGSQGNNIQAYQGVLQITGGSMTTAGDFYVGRNSFQTADTSLGTFEISNGALTVNGANFILGQTVNGATKVAQFTQTGGTVTHTGGWLALANGGGTSQMDINGGTFTTASALNIGIRGAGTVNVGGGTLNVNGINTGHSASASVRNADINVTSGALNVTGGNIILSNEAHTSSQYTQTGGAFTFAGGGYFYIGNMGAPTQSLSVSGGTFNASNSGGILLAVRGTASLNVSGTAEVALTNLGIGHVGTTGATGIVNLNGGRLTLGSVFENTGGHTSTFNFNGGTLRAGASSTTFMQGLDNAYVKSGGAIIDTQGFGITIAQPLLHDPGLGVGLDGGLTVNGTNNQNNQLTLSGANTYNGGTVINAGRVQGTVATAFGTGPVTVKDNAQVWVSANTTYANEFLISGNGWSEGAGQLGAIRFSGGAVISGPVTLQGNSRITAYGGGDTGAITGMISGNYSLEKTGAGDLLLGGAASNTYTGTTTMTQGRIGLSKTGGAVAISGTFIGNNVSSPDVYTTANNQFAPGVVMSFVGTGGDHVRFELLGTTQTLAGIDNSTASGYGVIQHKEQVGVAQVSGTSTLILNGTGSYTFNGYLRDTGGSLALIKTNTGTQVLSGGNITYSGGTTINGGEIQLTAANVGRGDWTINSGGVLRGLATDSIDAIRSTTINSGGRIIQSGGSYQQFYNGGAGGTVLILNGGSVEATVAAHANYGNFLLRGNVLVGGTNTSVISADFRMGDNATRDFNVGVTGDPSGIDLDITGNFSHFNGVTWGYMTKSGAGTMRFSSTSTNQVGKITVNAGKVLFVDNMNGMGNGGLLNNAAFEASVGTGLDKTFAQPISGTGTFTKSGTGTLQFNGGSQGIAQGQFNIQQGKLQNNNNSVNWSGNTGSMDISNGATLDLYADAIYVDKLTGLGTVTNTYGNSSGYSGGAQYTEKFVIGVNHGSSTFGGTIKDTGIAGAGANQGLLELQKTGSGTITLTGVNTYTGDTTISGGTLKLDFSASGAPAGNILSSGSVLALAGGTLAIQGKGSTTSSQTVNGLTLKAGGLAIIVASGSGGTANLTLGAITRTGGVVDFTLPGSGSITTTTGNTNGILGPWATVGGTDWAANDGTGKIVAYSGYTDIAALGSTIPDASAANVRINSTGSGGNIVLGAATTTINTLLQNTATAATVDTVGQTLRTGSIQIGSGQQALKIGAAAGDGTLSAATAGGDLALINNSGNALTINAAVADNTSASSLNTSGTGTVTLSGANTYTGGTTINQGTLQVGDGGTTGTIGTGSVTNNAALVFNRSDNFTIGNTLSGTGNVLKQGAGTMILTAANSYQGGTTISQGTLQINSPAALPTAGTTSIAGGTTVNLLSGGDNTYSNIFTGSGRVLLTLSGGTSNTSLNGASSLFTGTLELAGSGSNKLNATGLTISPTALIQINSGAQLFTAINLANPIQAIGTGNGENRGAIRLSGGTLSGPITLLGNTTFGTEGGAVSGAITSGAGSPLTLTLGTGSSGGSPTFSGAIGGGTGTIALTVSPAAAGQITLSGANTYTGGTTIASGRVNASSLTAFGTGLVTVQNGAQAFVTGAGTYANNFSIVGNGWTEGAGQLGAIRFNNNTVSGTVTLAGNARLCAYGSSGTITGAVQVGANALELYTQGGNLYLNGPVSGSGTITKTGNYSAFLGGDNSGFTGTYYGNSSNTMFSVVAGGSPSATYVVNAGTLNNVITGTPTISLGALAGTGGQVGNNVGGSAVTFSIGALGSNTTYAGTIMDSVGGGGTTAITKVGTGTLTLSGASTYSGGTSFNAGTVTASSDNNLGAANGPLTFNGGTLQTTGNFTAARAVTLNSAGGTFNTDPSTTLTVPAVITGSGSLTKAGTGTLVLAAQNSYGGATVINAGTIQLQKAPTAPLGGGLYWLDATTGVTESAGSVSAWNDQSGNGRNFTQGTLANQPLLVSGAINGLPVVSFNGSTSQLVLGSSTSPQSVFIVNKVMGGGSNIDGIWGQIGDIGIRLYSATTWGNPGNGGDFSNPAGSAMYINGVLQAGNGTFTAGQAHLVEVVRSSASTWASTGIGEYGTGGAANRFYNGYVGEVIVYGTALSTADRQLVERYLNYKWFGVGVTSDILPTTTAVQLNSGATLDLNGINQTIGSLANGGGGGGAIVNGNASLPLTLTINPVSGSTTFSGSISDGGPANAISLVKSGAGTQVLAGADTYSGTTAINAGTLLVNDTHTGGGAYTVAGGATLGGTGTISAPVTALSGGHVAPGNNLGTLHTGNLDLQTGSFFDVELTPTAWDMLDVTGSVNVGGAILNLSPLASFSGAGGSQYIIVNNDSTDPVSGVFAGLGEGASIEVGGAQFAITYVGGTDRNDIVLTSVPEPATMILLGLAATSLGGYLRRRRETR